MNRNSSNTSSNRVRQRRKTPFITKNVVKGGKLNVPANPPDVVVQPWNQTTVAFQTTAGAITLQQVYDKFLYQFDSQYVFVTQHSMWDPELFPPGEPNPWKSEKHPDRVVQVGQPAAQIRIHSIRVWNLTGRAVSLSVYDYASNTSSEEVLTGLVDTGSPDTFPRVGYSFPIGIRQFIFYSNDSVISKKVICKLSSGNNDTLMVYVKIDWKSRSATAAPTFELDPIRALELRLQSSEQKLDNLLKVSKNIKTGTDKLVNAQPSTTKKIINNVATVASYVVPLVASDRLGQTDSILERINDLEDRISSISSNFSNIDISDNEDEHNANQLHI